MIFFRPIAIFFLFSLSIVSFAQQAIDLNKPVKKDTTTMTVVKVGDELVLYGSLPSVTVAGRAMTADERARFNRLKRNVLKVLPYARFARQRYEKLQTDLAITSDSRRQKKLVKECDDEVKDMFNREVKKMSITQGEILIKLIDRETGNSSYELVKQLRGGIKAVLYQTIARVVGHNLKEQYDPVVERDIESIIQASVYRNH